MNQEPVNVSPRADLEDYMTVMAERRIRHLPVAEQGHVLGVISSTDLLKLAIQQKDYVFEQLEQYIATGPQALERPLTQWGRVHGEHAGVEGGF